MAGHAGGRSREQHWPVEIGAYPESRVRALGFDPSQLTLDEQVELLEWYEVYLDEALGEAAEGVSFW